MDLLNLTPQAALMGAVGVLLLFGMAFGKGMIADADSKQAFNKSIDLNLNRLVTVEMQIKDLEGRLTEVQIINRTLTDKNKALDTELTTTRRELAISQGRVTVLEGQVKELETENREIRNENAKLRTELDALKAKVAGNA